MTHYITISLLFGVHAQVSFEGLLESLGSFMTHWGTMWTGIWICGPRWGTLLEYCLALFRRRTLRLHGTIEVSALDYDTQCNYFPFVWGPRAGFI